MSYVKTQWEDQEGQVRYTITEDGEGSGIYILTPNYEEVDPIGTPVNATNMNHIEDGIYQCYNDLASKNLDNLTSSGQKVIDGQWVKSYLEIFTQKHWNVGNTQETYDLSSYLPNDGYAYEVLLSADGNTGATAGASAEFFVGSAFCDVDSPVIWRARTRTNGDVCAGGMAILPIGADRKVYARMIVTTATTSTTFLYALAYRRIGTNS